MSIFTDKKGNGHVLQEPEYSQSINLKLTKVVITIFVLFIQYQHK